jgi:hypothetical protein
MANWSNPLLTSTYTNFLTEVKDRDTDLALQFDGTTSTNIPVSAIRWNSSINRWQKWNGTSWAELTSIYALTGLSTTGNATIGGTLGSGAITSTGSVSGTALIPTANTAPTNGVYLPNANTVGIATSSAGRVFVDASGRFGVGTSTPGTAIDVTLSAGSATTGNIRISPSTAGQARFHLFNGGAIAEWIFGQKTSTDHDFKLSKLLAGSEADYLTVNTSGSVGIGTTSPGSLLDVNGAITARGDGSNVALYMPGSTALRNTGTGTITYLDLATGGASAGQFVIRSSNAYAERFRIDSNGNVAIGTNISSSAHKLEVIGDGNRIVCRNATNGGEARIEAQVQNYTSGSTFTGTSISQYGSTAAGTTAGLSNANLGVLLFQNTSCGLITTNGGTPLVFATTNTERLRIDSNGRVGIGTTAPGTALDILVSAVSATVGNIRIAPSTAGQARFHLYNGGATAEWLFGQKTSTDHAFKLSKSVAGSEVDYLAVTTAGILQFDSGYGSNANAYGCRAWVNFDGTGTVTIRASANVSSITDNGIGDYTVNFTTAMPDANYAAVTNAVDRTASRVSAYATGSARVLTYDAGLGDSTAVSVAVFR